APGSGGTSGSGGSPGDGGATSGGGASGAGGTPGMSDGAAPGDGAPAQADAAEAGGIALRDSCSNAPSAAIVAAWTADPHFCLFRFADSVPGARQLAFAPNGDLFVSVGGQVVVLFDDNHNGVSEGNERMTYAPVPGANHGVALTATHVYASSP